jgi:hypothetical protein
MRTSNIATCLGVLSACFAISSPVAAKDNCSGHVVGLGSARVIIYDDRTLPMHLATGNCVGTGTASAQCHYKDKDGDEWNDVTEWVGVGLEGTWRTIHGTGKYEKTTDSSGWWKLVKSDPVDVWAIGGYCTLAAKKR